MSYCTAQNVLDVVLKGYSLTKLGSTQEAQKTYLERLLEPSKAIIDNAARRDFVLHEDDIVTLDGVDADRIAIWKNDATLCAPIVSVSLVKVYGQTLTITDLKVDKRAGIIGFQKAPSERVAIYKQQRGNFYIFPKDWQNVEVTLNWGYAEPPADVILAQELVIASWALSVISGAISGGARMVKVRDFEATYGTAGAYSAQIKGWMSEAEDLVRKYKTGRKSP